jgi:carboxyl-terminal processing protease
MPDPMRFGELVAGWLDPHGHWSAGNDAPPHALVFAQAGRLLAEIESSGDARCEASLAIGAGLADWMVVLRSEYDAAFDEAPTVSRRAALELGLEPAFDDDQVTTPARTFSRMLGRRLGAMSRAYGESLAAYVSAGRERYFPTLGAEGWQKVVLAAALRGYVAAIDPHGEWVPRDEEWSLYGGDPSFSDPDRLWGDMVRTAAGARVVDLPAPPLAVDDLVLAVDGVATTGLSVDQVEQLSRAGAGELSPGEPRRVIVLRLGDSTLRSLEVLPPETDDQAREGATDDDEDREEAELALELVPFGRSYAAVVTIPFVRDDLGVRLAEALDSLAPEGPPAGLLLDLRGNAGGSMDGATSALSLFLPHVPVFPLLHGGRVIEVISAEGNAPTRFHGPVAVLVDGATASAAEMIAGALDRYGRGLVLGQSTYGKGCVQEYFEDEAGVGILRLTTSLYALPDGSPVQRLGLDPSIALRLPASPSRAEHEADLPGALEPVRGPDVRVEVPPGPAWPSSAGRLGPCDERVVCAALESAARAPARAFRSHFSAQGRRREDPARR